ncbi:MAG: DUF2147 domain-containing protein [Bacteroidaceae bacterium]|nr:DUF2147 domain-containing protein [Bacteroidaceae bacterium]MBR6169914.1 DUF2147 domain-containing protein [Bacteroidaceae bacterium]
MKRFLICISFIFACVCAVFAQADKIVGEYQCEHDGVDSRIKIYKYADGYRAQCTWVSDLKMKDGTLRRDVKNPDPAKRNITSDKVVLIDKVKFDGKDTWKDGKIYDPTRGKYFTVSLSFKDDKTLTVKGYLGPFFGRVYWKKLK